MVQDFMLNIWSRWPGGHFRILGSDVIQGEVFPDQRWTIIAKLSTGNVVLHQGQAQSRMAAKAAVKKAALFTLRTASK